MNLDNACEDSVKIGDKGALYIAELLKVNKKLSHLDISNKKIFN
jgi:hypothetical protein